MDENEGKFSTTAKRKIIWSFVACLERSQISHVNKTMFLGPIKIKHGSCRSVGSRFSRRYETGSMSFATPCCLKKSSISIYVSSKITKIIMINQCFTKVSDNCSWLFLTSFSEKGIQKFLIKVLMNQIIYKIYKK